MPIPADVPPTSPPIAPDTVLAGLIRGINLGPPTQRPII